MSDDVRWFALDTRLSADEVRAHVQTALRAQRTWLRRGRHRARFLGTVDERRFILRTSSQAKEFALEGAMEPREDGTHVVVSVSALRRRPLFQVVAVILVLLGGCLGAWFEAQSDPDWPETAIGSTALCLGMLFGWLARADVTAAEATRISARLSRVIRATPRPTAETVEATRVPASLAAVTLPASLTLAALLAVMAVSFVTLPLRRSPIATPTTSAPTAAAKGPLGEVTLFGRAYPVSGGRGRYGPGRYNHELRLQDGRRLHYTTPALFGSGQCVKVRLREEGDRARVLRVEKHDGPCPEMLSSALDGLGIWVNSAPVA